MDYRANWTPNDDGTLVPRRTTGSVATRYSSADFTLVCQLCGDDYGNEPDLPLGVVAAHFEKHHPEHHGSLPLEMLWLGQGPTPKGN